jgi:anaerobic selenocysteine-containing dehydrogenase
MQKQTRDSISDIWGLRTPHHQQWPARIDERTSTDPDKWIPSTCVLCSTGCALEIGVKGGKIVGVRGREIDRVNRGRLGPKGLHGWEANHHSDRLTHPLIRDGGGLREASWEEAMQLVVDKAKQIRTKFTPGALGFYNSGQLTLEEYYTLGLLADVGVGTPHVDGNTRLCTATAAMALIESFGTDGNPGSYSDLDVTDAVFLFGHNMAETQTVLWMRVLDRRQGPRPPKLLVIDPRRTATAKEADLHLAPRAGTNLPLMNGLLHLILRRGKLAHEFIRDHTVGFDRLESAVETWTPERTSQLTRIPVKQLESAADLLGNTPTLVSTCLQGVYQSLQATATAVQVNNLHLVRGLIGRPGSTVFQMNGQPSSQNTRECGANGEMVAFRNWQNEEHIRDMARIWNVRPEQIPHVAPPTHAMQIFRHAETGSIRFLWIIATNAAVSLPELRRIRRILQKEDLFVIVSDAFRTETAELADVILPTALWGEKTGCITNADRTVHICHKAVEPPGEAKSDFDIFLEFAHRMDFRDKDGQPLLKWKTPEEAFNAWKECSRGRPCDYQGLSYARLSEGSGIQWPCNEKFPDGCERLYTDHIFNTSADYCEVYGHDLTTGAAITPESYHAQDPKGRAKIKVAEYLPPPEEPDDEYPLLLTTGRLVYHWHTRTKTARTPELQTAAPDAFIQMALADAEDFGIQDGDWIEITSRRASVRARAKIGDIEPGHLFIPFHFGDWDQSQSEGTRAANELTISGWDPVSKQPYFKYAAVNMKKVRKGNDEDTAVLSGTGESERARTR